MFRALRLSTVFLARHSMNVSVQSILLAMVLLVACLSGCRKNPQSVGPPIDACTLLTNDEVEALQGSPVIESKSSAKANNGLRVAQCYYATKESSNSVVLTVTQRDAEHPDKRTAKSVWDSMFSEEAREEREKKEEGEREDEEKIAVPTQISGIGDETYWTGARFGGALYVLKKDKDAFMRISVGGGGTVESKIEKSKAIARKALARL